MLYNEDALLQHKQVFLTEGWADAATLGDNGVASLGWSLSTEQRSTLLHSPVKHIVIVPDVGFYKQAVKTAMDFLDLKRITVLNIDHLAKWGKDVNEISINANLEEIYATLNSTPELDMERAIYEILE